MTAAPSAAIYDAPLVVVIEDNASIAYCLSSVLEAVGFDVVIAYSGREGLDRVAAETPALILLDLHLPDMHGGSVLRAIRADRICRTTPIVVLTGSDKISDVKNAVAFGADGYITKPFDPVDLVSKVSQFVKPPPRRAGGNYRWV